MESLGLKKHREGKYITTAYGKEGGVYEESVREKDRRIFGRSLVARINRNEPSKSLGDMWCANCGVDHVRWMNTA